MGGWLDYNPDMGWAYLDRAPEAQGGGARERTSPRADNASIRMPETVEILENDVLPIGDGSRAPIPGIEGQE